MGGPPAERRPRGRPSRGRAGRDRPPGGRIPVHRSRAAPQDRAEPGGRRGRGAGQHPGRRPATLGSLLLPVDGEGSVRAGRPLVSNGSVSGLLYDAAHAAAFDVPSTASATRGSDPNGFFNWRRFLHPPRVTSSTLSVAAGDGGSDAELIEAAGDGIWVQQLGWAVPDGISGAFGGEIRIGYRIRHGKLAEPVRGGTVGGVVMAPPGRPSLLRNIEALGSTVTLAESIASPTLLVRPLVVAGAAGSVGPTSKPKAVGRGSSGTSGTAPGDVRGVRPAEAGADDHFEPLRPEPRVGRLVGPEEARAVRGRHEAAFERPAADRAVRLRHVPSGRGRGRGISGLRSTRVTVSGTVRLWVARSKSTPGGPGTPGGLVIVSSGYEDRCDHRSSSRRRTDGRWPPARYAGISQVGQPESAWALWGRGGGATASKSWLDAGSTLRRVDRFVREVRADGPQHQSTSPRSGKGSHGMERGRARDSSPRRLQEIDTGVAMEVAGTGCSNSRIPPGCRTGRELLQLRVEGGEDREATVDDRRAVERGLRVKRDTRFRVTLTAAVANVRDLEHRSDASQARSAFQDSSHGDSMFVRLPT